MLDDESGPTMPSPPSLLDEALVAWTYARDGVIAELENIPGNEFGFQPSPHSRTVAELGQHIAESALMAAGELARPDGNFQRQDYPDFIHEYAGTRARATAKEPLIALLKTIHEEATARLRDAGELLLMQPIVQFNGEPATRLTWLHHAIAHEEYHRGQIALYARMLGHLPALTRLIQGG
ncbi:MAG: DinB family protein [Acidobacteriota bacterium]|nr:DinB family protein [Acidobacteriota bacterium]